MENIPVLTSSHLLTCTAGMAFLGSTLFIFYNELERTYQAYLDYKYPSEKSKLKLKFLLIFKIFILVLLALLSLLYSLSLLNIAGMISLVFITAIPTMVILMHIIPFLLVSYFLWIIFEQIYFKKPFGDRLSKGMLALILLILTIGATGWLHLAFSYCLFTVTVLIILWIALYIAYKLSHDPVLNQKHNSLIKDIVFFGLLVFVSVMITAVILYLFFPAILATASIYLLFCSTLAFLFIMIGFQVHLWRRDHHFNRLKNNAHRLIVGLWVALSITLAICMLLNVMFNALFITTIVLLAAELLITALMIWSSFRLIHKLYSENTTADKIGNSNLKAESYLLKWYFTKLTITLGIFLLLGLLYFTIPVLLSASAFTIALGAGIGILGFLAGWILPRMYHACKCYSNLASDQPDLQNSQLIDFIKLGIVTLAIVGLAVTTMLFFNPLTALSMALTFFVTMALTCYFTRMPANQLLDNNNLVILNN